MLIEELLDFQGQQPIPSSTVTALLKAITVGPYVAHKTYQVLRVLYSDEVAQK